MTHNSLRGLCWILLFMPQLVKAGLWSGPTDSTTSRKQRLILQSESFYAREKFLGQEGPNWWVRNTADGLFTVGVLPIKLKAFYTTEEGRLPNQISSFNLSVDVQQLRQNLHDAKHKHDFLTASAQLQARQQLKRQLQDAAIKHGIDTVQTTTKVPSPDELLQYSREPNVGMAVLSKRMSELQMRLNDPDYQQDMRQQKVLFAQTSGDTSLQARLINAEAKRKLDEHQQAEASYTYCKDARLFLQQFPTNEKVTYLHLQEQFRDSLGNASSGWTSWLQAIQKFDVGTVNINDHLLVANGLNLNGVDVKLKLGKLGFGAFYGQGVQAPYGSNATNRLCKGFRLGYGEEQKLRVELIWLQAEDEAQTFSDAGRKQLQNLVLGAKVMYSVGKQVKGESGYSRSLTTDLNLPGVERSSIEQLWNVENKGADAAYSKLTWRSANARSRLSGLARYTGNNYYSAGNPFLRKDNIRLEGKYDQKLFKNKLTLANTIRYDLDNPEGRKPGTSTLMNVTSVVSWRITRKWTLSPTYTLLDNYFKSSTNGVLHTRIHLAGATVVYNRILNNYTLVGSLTALRSWSPIQIMEKQQIDTLLQAGVSQQILATDFVLTNNLSQATFQFGVNWSALNQRQLTTASARCSYPILSGRLTVGHALQYLYDEQMQQRYGVLNSLQLNWGKRTTLKMTYDNQAIINLTDQSEYWNHLLWLTISILVF